jgi:ABC-type antimicrobial peptide transport system permease subunit
MKFIIPLLSIFLLILFPVFGQDEITISFSKNSFNELVMRVEGHTTPITIKIGDNKITLHVIENTVNLTALGINDLTEVKVENVAVEEEKVEEIETASGNSNSPDTQSPIPPVSASISPNPPLSTPF